ncbi:MAG TPA: thiamine-phosphate kinase [Edaphocola sp.]|nr:thiamine-phosphate kinase [Edaphocola sp.]
MEENKRTEINAIGEFGLIEYLTKNFEIKRTGTILGIGDDAAVIDSFGRQVLVTTELFIENIHFDLMYTPLKHLGYKITVAAISDICGMNGQPTQITVSVGVSNRFSVEAIEELYEGIFAACEHYKIDLIGGDTTASNKGLIISVTALGEVAPDKFITRSGAKKGDLICVTGDLGSAYLGLQLLEREKKVFLETSGIQPDLENRKHIIGRLLKPEARVDIVDWLEQQEITPTSMMDISDGLSSELFHICKASNVGCKIHEEKIPFNEEMREVAYQFQIDATACALNGGEDYELLFTVKQDDFDKIKFSEKISVVGYITDVSEGKKLVTRKGNEHELEAQGWIHFK